MKFEEKEAKMEIIEGGRNVGVGPERIHWKKRHYKQPKCVCVCKEGKKERKIMLCLEFIVETQP